MANFHLGGKDRQVDCRAQELLIQLHTSGTTLSDFVTLCCVVVCYTVGVDVETLQVGNIYCFIDETLSAIHPDLPSDTNADSQGC